MKGLTILILDDEEELAEELAEYLSSLGHQCTTSYHPTAALQQVQQQPFDVLLLDLKLPDMDGLEVLKQVKKARPEIEVIVMSGHGDIDSVTQAFRLGAVDFLQKSFRPAEIRIAIERTGIYQALQKRYRNLQARHRQVTGELADHLGAAFIGRSYPTERVLEIVSRAAGNAATPVLITGESGTGKELVARMVHYQSPRKEQALVTVNCAAVQRELFESEFFGHMKGAFTGAVAARTGLVARAHGGTLFLDEIGELSPAMQAKLLRVLEQGTYNPVGSDRDEQADVRIIAATNRNLREATGTGEFRRDLYYRLQTIEIDIPPLRERREDIEPLVSYFIEELSRGMGRRPPKLTDKDLRRLHNYSFPGNVRELKNIIERAMIMTPEQLELDIPLNPSAGLPDPKSPETHAVAEVSRYGSRLPTLLLSELEIEAIEEALRISRGGISRAAEILGISRQALDRRMNKYGIFPKQR